MKKAKIALVAIAVFAVVGGAYAFKAKRATDKIYYTTVPGGVATLTLSSVTLTAAPGASPLSSTFATTIYNTTTPENLVPYYRGQ